MERKLTVEEELELLRSTKEDYLQLREYVHDIWLHHISSCGIQDDPLKQLSMIEDVLTNLRAENSMLTSRTRGLLATVSHLGHYMDKEEINFRDIIRDQKDKLRILRG